MRSGMNKVTVPLFFFFFHESMSISRHFLSAMSLSFAYLKAVLLVFVKLHINFTYISSAPKCNIVFKCINVLMYL